MHAIDPCFLELPYSSSHPSIHLPTISFPALESPDRTNPSNGSTSVRQFPAIPLSAQFLSEQFANGTGRTIPGPAEPLSPPAKHRVTRSGTEEIKMFQLRPVPPRDGFESAGTVPGDGQPLGVIHLPDPATANFCTPIRATHAQQKILSNLIME